MHLTEARSFTKFLAGASLLMSFHCYTGCINVISAADMTDISWHWNWATARGLPAYDVHLRSAAGAYEIHFDKNVEMLFASIFPPRLFIKWQTISIYHALLNEQIPFPKVVSLNVIQAWKVRKMLTQRFYCVPLLIAGNKALLIRPIKKDAHSREGDDDWDETTATGIATTATAPGLDSLWG